MSPSVMSKTNRVPRSGELLCKVIVVGFIVGIVPATKPASISASTPDQLRTCKNAIIGLVGMPSSMVRVSVRVDNDQVTYPNIVDAVVTQPSNLPRENVAITASNFGSCEFNTSGELVKIDTLFYSGTSPREFKDFGEFPGLGHYIVISKYSGLGERKVGSYYLLYYSDGRNSNLFFPMLINGEKKWWWTDCQAKKIGRLNSDGIKETLPTSHQALSTAVIKFVCNQ